MSDNRWKFIVPGALALLQIGGSVYHNFFGKEKEAEQGTQRFELMLSDPSMLRQDGDVFRCYGMGRKDAERFFFRMSGGNHIERGRDARGETYLTVFPGGRDSLSLVCLTETSEDGRVAEVTLPGKDGVRKRVVFYDRPRPDGE